MLKTIVSSIGKLQFDIVFHGSRVFKWLYWTMFTNFKNGTIATGDTSQRSIRNILVDGLKYAYFN